MLNLSRTGIVAAFAAALCVLTAAAQRRPGDGLPPPEIPTAMTSPYRLIESWPVDKKLNTGAAIGIIPDGKSVWVHHRSDPPIVHFDAAGNMIKGFGEGMFSLAHGFCRDTDGNFWAGDSGPFSDNPAAASKSFVFYKFSPDGKLLMTLGKPGVSKAGPDTFIMPTACTIAPNGDVVIADGHWPRPSYAQQDGDRIVRYTKDGKFLGSWGQLGNGPKDFAGPHSVAFDSQGRLFVADRSNNRVVILDKNMQFVDEWRHFGRPSGVMILKDDTLIVSDSESGWLIAGPPVAPEGGGPKVRNPGWQNGIRIGSAKDGSLRYFIPNTRPEGLGASNDGTIYAGLTDACQFSKSGGCLQKYVKGLASAR